jgi:hypothetical protein
MPRLRGVFLLAAIGWAVAPSSILAHHSVTGQFNPAQPLTLKGVVSKVDWINPHIYVYLDVTDDRGSVTTWALETVPTAMARRAGLTRESLMGDGQPVTIEAIAARDAKLRLGFIYKITFADGRFVQLSAQR